MNVSHSVSVDSKGAVTSKVTVTAVNGSEEHMMEATVDIIINYREVTDGPRMEELIAADEARVHELFAKEITNEQLDEIFADIRKAAANRDLSKTGSQVRLR
ncbi:MAG: hypothetical protein LKF79_07380 [Solobacterium sp.]|nr:hypothetical protein [Solobacterium sp.]MCH4223219.1 hypothetical protein [Solobacterium sp.]MCH4266448.1 hypothetical protein [Solobacterium sp.]